jgi:predicted nucleotidyltransferase
MTSRLPTSDFAEMPFSAGRAVEELSHRSNVRALCMFGSVARGKWDDQSDVDLLAVVPSRSIAKALRAELRAKHLDQAAQVRFMTPDLVAQKFHGRTVFASHLAREGKVLVDRDGAISTLIADYPVDAPVQETARGLASQLEVYREIDWCAGHYLFCLSDLYAWGRSGSMLVLARQGIFEFDRGAVFERLPEAHPELQEAAETVSELRPFWRLVRRRERGRLPFPPVGSHKETTNARDACRKIIRAGL